MTELLNDVDTPSDAELISRVRGGDVTAYGELFSRHRTAADRLARQLVRGPDADDLVSEAFAKVLTVLQGGGGPDVAFRAYLLTAVRRLHVDRIRVGQRLQTTDDMTPFDPGVPFKDTAVAGFESGAAAKAFASLPERWQLVLWHLEVEGQKPADIAPLLGMSPNSVSALAYRAREGLRQAFLTMHLSDISETDCRWVNEHLGAHIRKGLSKRDAGKVDSHLEGCRRCTAMHLELTDVNSNLAAIIAPLLLGAAAAGYVASAGGATAVGVLSVFGRARDFAIAHTGGVVAGAVSVGVTAAAVATIAITHNSGAKPDVVADAPAGATSSAPAVPGAGPTASTSAGASRSPATAPTPTLTSSPTAGSAAASVIPAPLPGLLAPLASAVPTDGPTDVPTDGPTDGPTDVPTETPTDVPSDTPTGTPTEAPAPDPVVGDPVVADDGTVTITVANLRATDTLDVTMESDETTFSETPSDPTCVVAGPRHVTCAPGVALLRGRGRTAVLTDPVRDYTVSLGLDFPGYMVEDDLQVTATVTGSPAARSATARFHPSRTPAFDVPAPQVGLASAHTVYGDDDHFDFTTRAALPPRVAGLVYRVAGAAARFRPADAAPCSVSDDGSTMTCPEARDGDLVVVPLVAPSLAAADSVGLSVEPLVAFRDLTPDEPPTRLPLQPGADLGLDLAVQSANPDRNGLVALTGTLTGTRPGLTEVTYRVGDGATFAGAGNPAGCAPDGSSMTCPAPDGDQVALVVRAQHRNETTPITIAVSPGAPFEPVGAGAHAAEVTLPGRAVHDFSLSGLTESLHTLRPERGGTDVYTLTGVVGALPTGVRAAAFTLTGDGVFAAGQTDPRCRLDTTPDHGGEVTCDGLSAGDTVDLVVESTTPTGHDATVEIQPTDPFDDLDPTDNTQTLTGLRPGTHLVLGPTDLGRVHQDAAGHYRVTTTVSGVRDGVGRVRLHPGPGTSVVASGSDACSVVGDDLACDGLADGDRVSLTLSTDTSDRPTTLTLTASPGGDFVELYDDATVTAALVPSWNFAIGALTRTSHRLDGAVDEYTLSGSVRRLPGGLDTLSFDLTDGGTFAASQDGGCARVSDTRVTCDGLADGGLVEFHVRSAAAVAHPTRIALRVPDGYDDPTPGDDAASVTVQPGVDLALAALDPDNESPTNDDDEHLVATTLSGVRPGLGRVTYLLTGSAAFVRADAAGCTADGRTMTCTHPADGDVTFTVRATDVRAATPVGITVLAPAPFVELDEADNVSHTVLAARPTYDFSVGVPELVGHDVVGRSDHFTVGVPVAAVPAGVPTVTFAVTGGSFAADQPAGCSPVDAFHVSCGDLATARTVRFRVDSDLAARHPVVITLQTPRRYDDPTAGNDTATLTVTPGTDLHVGPLTPVDPQAKGDLYTVTSVVTGVRTGPVTFTLTGGATAVGSSCTVSTGTKVICGAPSDGMRVSFTLRPDHPSSGADVTLTATPAPSLLELDPTDNAAGTTLTPDVSLDSLTVTTHRLDNEQAVVRARLSGAPSTLDVIRIRISGAAVGTGNGQVHLTDGVSGADGEQGVDCYTSDVTGKGLADGVYATCTGISTATNGAFFVDMRLAHPHGTNSDVTFTVLPVGVDERARTANNARVLTVR